MAGELAQWMVSTPAQREHLRDVARVRKEAALAVARVAGVGQVGQAATLGALSLSMAKREASLLVPEDAAKFDLIATQAAIAMAAQINWVAGQW